MSLHRLCAWLNFKKFSISLIIILSLQTSYALNYNNWVNANNAYNRGNLKTLAKLAKNNDLVIGYLNANANLARANPAPALSFVNSAVDSSFKNDILHQLLTYTFNNQDWPQYIKLYILLPSTQTSTNETCGYDLANFALHNHQPQLSSINDLLPNKMPLWGISLLASKFATTNTNSKQQTIFLYNLISNEQVYQFNQVATNFKVNKINLNSNTRNTNPYQIVYHISSLSSKAPDTAYYELAQTKLDQNSKEFLYNLVAADLATKHMFSLAAAAINNGNEQFLSSDEYEWRVRTFLALSQWQMVIATINAMPDKLQNKNSWLYWPTYAANQLNQPDLAKQSLAKIPHDYSYYSLLAQAELNTILPTSTHSKNESGSNLPANINLCFDLYQTAKNINSDLFMRMATQNLRYLSTQANDDTLIKISQKAFKANWNDVGIYAATKLDTPNLELSFPLLFVDYYQQYSQKNDVDSTFPIAVTRQESRFNQNALAFDGGVGLMQIMPNTASYIAKKTGSSNCYKNYECNIKFGTWYLANLTAKFNYNLIYTLAGYNAGPSRAYRWQQSLANLDKRIQIELIPFSITRDYVQKVITNKMVYDSRLNNSSLNLIDYLQTANTKIANHISAQTTTTEKQ